MTDEQSLRADVLPAKRRSLLWLLLVAALLAGATYLGLSWRQHSVNGEVEKALAGETGAVTPVYRRKLIGGNDIVFDVSSSDGELSMVDMTRRLLKTAEALQNEDYDRVYLANKGREKFYLEGPYFKQLGQERQSQNPVYTIRTMPENVRKLDGSPAFETWTGGLLGVMGGQMEDNAEFHRQWWVNEALTDLSAS